MDNFDFISNLMEFPNKDIFYVVSIIQRKKDFPNDSNELVAKTKTKEHFIRHYFIGSNEDLLKFKDSIIRTCNLYNARAYFGLDGKNIKKVLKESIKSELELLTSTSDGSQLKSYRNLFNSVSRIKETTESSLRFVHIDADFKDTNLITKLIQVIDKYQFIKLNSKNGFHFIRKIRDKTKGNVNIQELGELLKEFRSLNNLQDKDLELKMNSMILLYYPENIALKSQVKEMRKKERK